MNTAPRDHPEFRAEALRLSGERATRARTLDVFDPYTGMRVGTAPLASIDVLAARAARGRDRPRRRLGVAGHRVRHARRCDSHQQRTPFGLSSCVCTNRQDAITRFINELRVGTVDVWEVPGYRIEMTPFGGIKDSGLG
ncbi:acyl-CoA reductase-like NAD-dependent aldehyde dehydrogenase [Paraburkholderia sp. WSM4175]